MKTNFFKWILIILALFMVNTMNGQTGWSLNGNAGTDPAVNFIGTTDNKTFKIKTNNVTRINIISSGKVGIGNFTPVWRFDVQGGSINTDSLYRIKGASVLSANASGIQIGATGAKVGIGTASPVDALQVVGTISATGGNSTNWNSAFSWGNHGTQGYLKGAGLTANRLTLWNGSTLVNSSITETGGSIGIGTASPAAFLHVNTTGQEVARFTGGTSIFNATGMFMSLYESGNYRGYIGSYSGAAQDVDFGTGGTNTTGSVHLTIAATPRLTVNPSGNTGIGTTNPVSRLSVEQTGTLFPTMELINNSKGPNISYAHFGTSGDWYLRSAANAGKVILQDQSSTGTVAIGTTYVPFGYKLAVSGKVICSELKVQLPASWPDYVFGDDYSLMSLSELRSYVDNHHHLPGIPSAEAVENNGGVEVGEMQRLLVEKVEELTLYILQQDEKIRNLQTAVEQLKK